MNRTLGAKKKKRTTPRVSSDSDSVKPVFLCTLKGFAVGIASALPLLLAACAIAMNTADPASFAGPLSYLVLLAGALIGGFASAKLNGGDGMLCGIMCGALYLAFVFLVSLFLHNTEREHTSFILSLGLRSVTILSSMIGGSIASGSASKPKKRKRH